MAIPREAYTALESIVGKGYLSNDPVILETYIRGGAFIDTPVEDVITRPDCVLLPQTTAEVQEIVKVCCRYKLPFIPISTFWTQDCGAKGTDFVLIDLKRMNGLEIDEQNMYAVVEPGVIYSQLQEEAMKRGLYTLSPGGGAQVSVLGNHLSYSFSPLCYRVGIPARRILGVEWVLGDGEIVRIGSLATQDDPFWGEGLGPDLRALLRGVQGWGGRAGIVTKMAVKLFPFISPERLEPEGISPETSLKLPLNRVRWFNITMPSEEALLQAMAKISASEIAAAIMKVPILWRYRARARSKEEFWEKWISDAEEIEKNPLHILRVLLIGYTSEEQLEYEKRVLEDIVAEAGGQFRRTRPTDESWFKTTDAVSMWWTTGGYSSVDYIWGGFSNSLARGESLSRMKPEFTPPMMDEYGEKGWIQAVEFGHSNYFEFLVQWDPASREGGAKFVDLWVGGQRSAIDDKQYTAMLSPYTVTKLTGAPYGPNYSVLQDQVHQLLDPNNLSNPPLHLFDRLVEEKAPYLKQKYSF